MGILMRKTKAYLILILLLLIYLLTENFAYANGGPTHDGPNNMSAIFFDENTNISLVEETILFSNFEKDSPHSIAKVSVDYKLKNMDATKKSLNIFFMVPHYSTDFFITMNGSDITDKCKLKDIQLPDNWIPSSSDVLFNPENGEVLSSNYYINAGHYLTNIRGMEIPISINKNENITLNVEYKSEGGYYKDHKVKNTVHGFMYYLTPAKFWSGTPNVTLKIELPSNNKYLFYSNIPLEKIKSGVYEAHLKDIPDSEWLFSFNSMEGLIYGTNNTRIHLTINIIVSLLILILFTIFSKVFDKKYLTKIGYVISIFILFRYTGKIYDGYLGDVLIYMCLIFVLLFIVPMIYIWSIIRKEQKTQN